MYVRRYVYRSISLLCCIDNYNLWQTALLVSIMNGKVFMEWVCPAVLKAYQWQVSISLSGGSTYTTWSVIGICCPLFTHVMANSMSRIGPLRQLIEKFQIYTILVELEDYPTAAFKSFPYISSIILARRSNHVLISVAQFAYRYA